MKFFATNGMEERNLSMTNYRVLFLKIIKCNTGKVALAFSRMIVANDLMINFDEVKPCLKNYLGSQMPLSKFEKVVL